MKILLKCLAALSFFVAGMGLAGVAWAQAKPSVLVIMLDDLDVPLFETALRNDLLPNIREQVIEKGTTFTESFVTTPLCCPSRSTYMTGQYAHNHGVYRNQGPFGGFEHFEDASTLATWMRDAGYRTGHVGKYLNGYDSYRYVPPGWDFWRATVGAATYCMYNYRVSENGTQRRFGDSPQDYQTDVLARYADEFIRTVDTRPFFLNVAVVAPHNELCTGKTPDSPYGQIRPAPRHLDTPSVSMPAGALDSFSEADMSDKPLWMRSLLVQDLTEHTQLFNQKMASLRAADDLVGTLFRAAKDAGKARNMAVIFVSDNGYFYGSHRLQQKTLMYEEALRVPLIIRAPGQSKPRVATEWVLNTDWAATILDYGSAVAGLPQDGRSLVPLARGEKVQPWRTSFLMELVFDGEPASPHYPYLAIRSKDSTLTGDASGRRAMVYGETYDAVTNILTDLELYDLNIDPQQIRSLHESNSSRRLLQMQALQIRLQSLKSCGAGSCQTLEE